MLVSYSTIGCAQIAIIVVHAAKRDPPGTQYAKLFDNASLGIAKPH